MSDTQPTHEELLARARSGAEEDWAYIDAHLTAARPDLLAAGFVRRAVYEHLGDDNTNVRDFGMRTLDRSDEPLDEAMTGIVRDSMIHDKSEVVRLRAAVALYKRGADDDVTRSLWAKAAERKDALGRDARDAKRSALH